ncbi:hypothetical protein PILCRDRAFT_11584 [Piloderma croceum F 1598]|uniref:Uncharacterized protein n=1 Tax=Piloderma croceum (strain F 1598) TaxID=765440 RepID=A0A0C3FDP3_PILCF|nr:hypothetical protein PILCRDRAFT_11584 [Piloderma croceum F 1598]
MLNMHFQDGTLSSHKSDKVTISVSAAAVIVDQVSRLEGEIHRLTDEAAKLLEEQKRQLEARRKIQDNNATELLRFIRANKELLDAQERQLAGADYDDSMNAQSEDKTRAFTECLIPTRWRARRSPGRRQGGDLDAHVKNYKDDARRNAEQAAKCIADKDPIIQKFSNELAKQADTLHNKVSEMTDQIEEGKGQGLPVTYSRAIQPGSSRKKRRQRNLLQTRRLRYVGSSIAENAYVSFTSWRLL